jgi:hypothetical protein
MGGMTNVTMQANDGVQGNYSATDYDVPGVGVGIYNGAAAGDVAIETVKGTTVVFKSVPAGTFMQVPLFKRVVNASTTATDITISFIRTHPDA